MALDTATFAAASRRFAISRNVAQRAERFNGAAFMPLYPPPTAPESYYCAESQPFIFAPSRLETLKRQDLLIKAMAHVKSPVVALIAGDGGQRPTYERLIHTLGLQDKVRLLGAVDDATLRAGYANATAIFFGPRDEDYGYVTLEAMLSAKPVLTCNDSGGPHRIMVEIWSQACKVSRTRMIIGTPATGANALQAAPVCCVIGSLLVRSAARTTAANCFAAGLDAAVIMFFHKYGSACIVRCRYCRGCRASQRYLPISMTIQPP